MTLGKMGLSADGSFLFAYDGQRTRFWRQDSLQHFREAGQINGRMPTRNLLVHPKGDWLFGRDISNKVSVLFNTSNPRIGKLIDNSKIHIILENNYKLSDGKEVSVGQGAAFSPDGQYLVQSLYKYPGNSIGFWSLPSGVFIKSVGEFAGDKNVIRFSKAGDKLAIAWSVSEDGSIFLMDTTGRMLDTLRGHTASVRTLDFSPDGNHLLSSSTDGSVRLWSLATGQTLATLILVNDYDWILVTPDGYYTGTPDAAASMYFSRGSSIYPFEQFDTEFNRPDIILKRIGNYSEELISLYETAYQKRLKQLGTLKSDSSFKGKKPIIEFVGQQILPLIISTNDLKFTIRAFDPNKYQIQAFHIRVNGVPIFGIDGYKVTHLHQDSTSYTFSIRLVNESNKIQISCTNVYGQQSDWINYEVICENPLQKANIYFIGVGVNIYKDTTYNLLYAAKDIDDLETTFKKVELRDRLQEKRKYNGLVIHLLKDKSAIRDSILAIRNILLQTAPEDVVIMSFNGHGILSENLDFYFATYDTNFKDPTSKGLRFEEIEGLLDGIPARNKLLLLDACHSGEVEKKAQLIVTKKVNPSFDTVNRGAGVGLAANTQSRVNAFELMLDAFSNVSPNTGATVIAASGGREFAQERNSLKNGVFTHCVLDIIEKYKHSLISNGELSVRELREEVIDAVEILTKGQQHPTSRRVNTATNFKLPVTR